MTSFEDLASQSGVKLKSKTEITPQDKTGQKGSTVNFEELATKAGVKLNALPPKPVEKPGMAETPTERTLKQRIPGILEKGISAPAEFLFGKTGETVGTLLGSGFESAKELITGEEQPRTFRDRPIGKADIAFTALELYPGGGFLSGALKKLPGGAKVASKINDAVNFLPDKMKEKAIKLYTEALAPTTKETKQLTAKIVPELLERGETGTLKGLQSRALEATVRTGEQIDEVIETQLKGNKVETKPVLEAINNFKKKFIVDGQVIEPQAVKVAEDVENVILEFGDEIDAENLIKVRRIWDKMIKQKRKGFGLDDMTTFSNDVKKEATAAIRSVLAEESPDLAKLNKEFSFWANVDDVATATLERTAGQSGKLRQRIGQLIGAVIGSFGGIAPAIAGTAIGDKVAQGLSSTLWKTKSASFRNKFSDALVNNDFDTLKLLLKELGVGVENLLDTE